MVGATARGLSMSDCLSMDLGQIVDYVVTWNEFHAEEFEDDEKPKRRKATQADWDALGGYRK